MFRHRYYGILGHPFIEVWDKLGNQVCSIICTLFLNNDAIFQGDSFPIHTAGTVKSWFEEHEGDLYYLPSPAGASD